MKPIPISAAEKIAKSYDCDQVVIVARAVDGGEHVTTYGRDKANCAVAAQIGDFLKHKVMNWRKENFFKEGQIYAQQEAGYLAGVGLEPKMPDDCGGNPDFDRGYHDHLDRPDHPLPPKTLAKG